MELQAHVLECYPQEACGVLIQKKYIPLENKHANPVQGFKFPQKVSQFLATSSTPYRILHSHTMEIYTGDPRTPSEEDMKGQIASTVDWGITHTDGETVSDILWFGAPRSLSLVKRPYIENVNDCFTLVRDYYFQNYGIDLGSFPRPKDWEAWNPNYIEKMYLDIPCLQEIETGNYQIGDILGLKLGSSYLNHLGVCNTKETFIHHLRDRISSEDKILKWKKQIYRVFRYAK